MVAMNYVNSSVFKDGFDITIGRAKLDIFPYFFFGTFISLAWFWFMPRFATIYYLSDKFDSPRYRYIYTLGLYRFLFLITDDPTVISKERGGN